MGRPSKSVLRWIFEENPANGRVPDFAAPFWACGRNIRTHHSTVEELHHVRALAGLRQELQEGLEHSGAAEPPEPLPDAVPIAKLGWQSPPRDAVHREVMQCLQEVTVIVSGFAPLRLRGVEYLQHNLPILFRHLCQHDRLPDAGLP
jgi:hypothetical protein